jgi:monoamine oxidase
LHGEHSTYPVNAIWGGEPRDLSLLSALWYARVRGRSCPTRAWMQKPPAVRKSEVLDEFVKFFGEQARHPRQYVEDDSAADELWIRGCSTVNLPPGVLSDFGPAIREPIGRLHWAGSETSTYWSGYMDGAVRSGLRVANEVLGTL